MSIKNVMMPFENPTEQVEEIIRLKVELAKNKYKIEQLDSLQLSNRQLSAQVQSITALNKEQQITLLAYHRKIESLAMLIKIDYTTAACGVGHHGVHHSAAHHNIHCANCPAHDSQQQSQYSASSIQDQLIFAAVEQKILALLKQIQESEAKIRGTLDFQAKSNNLQSSLTQINDKFRISEQNLARKQQINTDLNQQNKRLILQINSLSVQLQQFKNRQRQLANNYESFKIQHANCRSEITQLRNELERCQNNLNVMQHETVKTTNNSENAIEACEQLLRQFEVKEDDYLKSYLLTSRSTTDCLTTSRKTKYEFVFSND